MKIAFQNQHLYIFVHKDMSVLHLLSAPVHPYSKNTHHRMNNIPVRTLIRIELHIFNAS